MVIGVRGNIAVRKIQSVRSICRPEILAKALVSVVRILAMRLRCMQRKHTPNTAEYLGTGVLAFTYHVLDTKCYSYTKVPYAFTETKLFMFLNYTFEKPCLLPVDILLRGNF